MRYNVALGLASGNLVVFVDVVWKSIANMVPLAVALQSVVILVMACLLFHSVSSAKDKKSNRADNVPKP